MTPSEAVDAVLARGLDDHSFIEVTSDLAVEAAARSTARLMAGRSLGPLDGLPVAVKDCIDVLGVRTTNGSVAAGAHAPAATDAGIVRLLKRHGAVLVGKTNQSELAFTGLGMNPHFGSPRNPLSAHEPLVPGGSSSGSAVAVAAGHVPLAIGTDTSGSTRIPAAFCGIVGYKSSEHLFPMDGVRPLSPALDSIGILTRSTADLRRIVDVLGPLPRRARRPAGSAHLVLVVPQHEVVTACEPDVRSWFDRQIEELGRLDGVVVETRELPVLADAQELMDTYGTLVASDAHAHYGHLLDRSTVGRLDPAVMRRLEVASRLGGRTEPVRRSLPVLRRRLVDELGGGLLLCPTVRHRPPPMSALMNDTDAFDDTNVRTLRTTMLLSYLGMPGVSVPRGAGRVLGMGLLVSAPSGEDARLLEAASMIDRGSIDHCVSGT